MAKYIVLAEDDPDDQSLFQEALSELCIEYYIQIATDGQMLLNILEHSSKRLPDIIVSDINMPRINGLDCLRNIRENTRFKCIPIVILSSSKDEALIEEAYSRGANYFASKPSSFCALKKIVDVIIYMDWIAAAENRGAVVHS
jgi:CheY-like chemotaxis protein